MCQMTIAKTPKELWLEGVILTASFVLIVDIISEAQNFRNTDAQSATYSPPYHAPTN